MFLISIVLHWAIASHLSCVCAFGKVSDIEGGRYLFTCRSESQHSFYDIHVCAIKFNVQNSCFFARNRMNHSKWWITCEQSIKFEHTQTVIFSQFIKLSLLQNDRFNLVISLIRFTCNWNDLKFFMAINFPGCLTKSSILTLSTEHSKLLKFKFKTTLRSRAQLSAAIFKQRNEHLFRHCWMFVSW